MKKIGWPRLYVFLLKTVNAWILKKFRFVFGRTFTHTTNVFQRKHYKEKFSLIFFASFDNFKALLGCFEKREIFANDLVYKPICISPVRVLTLSLHFKETDVKSVLINHWLDLIRLFLF